MAIQTRPFFLLSIVVGEQLAEVAGRSVTWEKKRGQYVSGLFDGADLAQAVCNKIFAGLKEFNPQGLAEVVKSSEGGAFKVCISDSARLEAALLGRAGKERSLPGHVLKAELLLKDFCRVGWEAPEFPIARQLEKFDLVAPCANIVISKTAKANVYAVQVTSVYGPSTKLLNPTKELSEDQIKEIVAIFECSISRPVSTGSAGVRS